MSALWVSGATEPFISTAMPDSSDEIQNFASTVLQNSVFSQTRG